MTDDTLNDRSYIVESCEHGVALYGAYAPTDDVSALLKNWAYRGLRFQSLKLAKRLDALVVVVENLVEEETWIQELGTPCELK